jgi:hypothetical protein
MVEVLRIAEIRQFFLNDTFKNFKLILFFFVFARNKMGSYNSKSDCDQDINLKIFFNEKVTLEFGEMNKMTPYFLISANKGVISSVGCMEDYPCEFYLTIDGKSKNCYTSVSGVIGEFTLEKSLEERTSFFGDYTEDYYKLNFSIDGKKYFIKTNVKPSSGDCGTTIYHIQDDMTCDD